GVIYRQRQLFVNTILCQPLGTFIPRFFLQSVIADLTISQHSLIMGNVIFLVMLIGKVMVKSNSLWKTITFDDFHKLLVIANNGPSYQRKFNPLDILWHPLVIKE